MKIPDATAPANIGAYYGNEENGQWQPNGVLIDSGVGGGVVGSGDAGVHRAPVYPVHIPRGHVPGYVMAGAYYPPAYPPAPPAPQDDFADYMWMENEEEFDKQVMQQLEEEALMEQCIEAMLEDQQRERASPAANGHNNPTTSNGASSLSLEETVSRSTLNPLAAEFVPTRRPPPQPQLQPPPAGDKSEVPETSSAPEQAGGAAEAGAEPCDASGEPEPRTDGDSEVSESTPTPTDPPEVSAADVQPISDRSADRRPKDTRKEARTKLLDAKKTIKQEPKRVVKAAPVKSVSEPKVQTPVKKREVKACKSETSVDRPEDRQPAAEEAPVVAVVDVDVVKRQPSPPPSEETVPSGPKPINYAAAAKANKPRKPSSPPITEKTLPPPPPPPAKMEKPIPVATTKPDKTKPATKTIKDKPIQRKNSAK